MTALDFLWAAANYPDKGEGEWVFIARQRMSERWLSSRDEIIASLQKQLEAQLRSNNFTSGWSDNA